MAIPNQNVKKIDCKQGAVRAVRFNADGNYCLTCGGNIKLWNPIKGLLLQTYSGHGYDVLDAQGSHDSSKIASGAMDRSVLLSDVSTAQVVRRFRGHASHVNCVKFNQESTVILSGSVDGTLKAWDCKSQSRDAIQIFDEAKDSVTSVAVSSYEILTGSLDCKLRRYDLRKGFMYCDDIKSSITSVNFTKDGQCTLVSCLNNSIKLLDKESGELLAEFKGHVNSKYKIDSCLTSSDTIVLSGSEDGYIYCWNLVEGKLLTKLLHTKNRAVHSLSSHPTEIKLISACEKYLFLWSDTELELDNN